MIGSNHWIDLGGQQDMTETSFHTQFHIPDILYGRETELQLLQNAYQRTLLGRNELVFVSGVSGIGKTQLLHEFQKTVHTGKGLFIWGKFDQFRQDTPFDAIHQLGKQLKQYLLSLEKEDFAYWRQQLLDAVGSNGQVLIDMNPELEQVIGPQPALPKLPPSEVNNRFLLVIQKYISTFTKHDHPLVMVVDDIQWADPASLHFLYDMLASYPKQYLMVILMYREQEIAMDPAFRTMLDKLQQCTLPNKVHIALKPLQETHLELMVKDSLGSINSPAAELAKVLLRKTGGNPFFIKQFFRSLHEQNLIAMDSRAGTWSWELKPIEELYLMDNVAELVTAKVHRLPGSLQDLLKKASCIGHEFPLLSLSWLTALDQERLAQELQPAENAGLLLRLPSARTMQAYGMRSPVYQFMHDRVHHAAYTLLDDKEKESIHLQLGRSMLEQLSWEGRNQQLITIANHYHLGSAWISDPSERLQLAELNLKAARNAKIKTAYKHALTFIKRGLSLLPNDVWKDHYALRYALHLEKAELEYLTGDFTKALQSFELLLVHAQTNLDKATIYTFIILLYANNGDHEQAVQLGMKGLRLLDVPFRPSVNKASLLWELARTRWHIGWRHPEDLLDVPEMTDPEHLAVMQLMVNLIPSTFILNADLNIYLVLRMLRYSLLHGNSEGSSFAYSAYGAIISVLFGQLRTGSEYAHVGLRLCENIGSLPLKCKVYFHYGSFTYHIKSPYRVHIDFLRKAYQCGVDCGDFVYAGYSTVSSLFLMLMKGDSLPAVQQQTENYAPFVIKTQNRDVIAMNRIIERFVQYMQTAETAADKRTSESFISELEQEQLSNQAVIFTYHSLQMQMLNMEGRYAEAKAVCTVTEPNIRAVSGFPIVQLFHIQRALMLCALFEEQTRTEQKRSRAQLQKSYRLLKRWAEYSPDNFLHLFLFIKAERARLSGRMELARIKYEQAVHCAHAGGFMHHEAMIKERAARFHQEEGRVLLAQSHLMQAHQLYREWGALRKVRQLEAKHPYLCGQHH
jgi:predicted ATPase